MREIKFRGMSINGGWHYGLLCIVKEKQGFTKSGSYISNSMGMPFAYHVRPETVGQFTGLKGKSGVEIYEGDIVATPERDVIFTICFGAVDEVSACFYYMSKKGRAYPMDRGCAELEVIGNTYSNPELIN